MSNSILAAALALLLLDGSGGEPYQPDPARKTMDITSHEIHQTYQIDKNEMLLIASWQKDKYGYQEGKKLIQLVDNGSGLNFGYQSDFLTAMFQLDPFFFRFEDRSVLMFAPKGNEKCEGLQVFLLKNDKCSDLGFLDLSAPKGKSPSGIMSLSLEGGIYTVEFNDQVEVNLSGEESKLVEGELVSARINAEGVELIVTE